MYWVLFLAALIPYSTDIGYWVTDKEIVVMSALLLAPALLLAEVYLWKPTVGRIALALTIYWIADFYFIEIGWLAILSGLAILAILFTRFESNVLVVSAFFAVFFLVPVLVTPGREVISPSLSHGPSRNEDSSNNLPPVIHLVFDEHISPAALPDVINRTGSPEKLVNDYVSRGFAVFPNTRSISGATQISLSQLMGMTDTDKGGPDTKNVNNKEKGFNFGVRKNNYFDSLIEKGYKLNVIQSSFLRMCEVGRVSCYTYSRADYGHAMSRFENNLADRVFLVLMQLHLDSLTTRAVTLYRPLGRFLQRNSIGPRKRQYWTRPAAMLSVMQGLEDAFSSVQKGEAYVVHILLPHFPYILNEQCGLNQRAKWLVPLWVRGRGVVGISVEETYQAYWEQTLCLHKYAMRLIDKVLSNPSGKDAIFLVHGDHGARVISKLPEPKEQELTSGKPQEALDTFFAVKAPNMQRGVNVEHGLLQDRFSEITGQKIFDSLGR